MCIRDSAIPVRFYSACVHVRSQNLVVQLQRVAEKRQERKMNRIAKLVLGATALAAAILATAPAASAGVVVGIGVGGYGYGYGGYGYGGYGYGGYGYGYPP